MYSHYDELIEQFEEMKYRYSQLVDSDVLEAFSLMRDSSSLLASWEQMSADAYKLTADAERMAKATEAKRSCELSSKPTDGARKAAFDQDVIDAWKRFSELNKQQKYTEANAKFLSRVYFDSKMIVENCYRQTRPPVGDNKIVGRT
jgi:hypothetical protein